MFGEPYCLIRGGLKQKVKHPFRIYHKIVHHAIVLGLIVIEPFDPIGREMVNTGPRVGHQDRRMDGKDKLHDLRRHAATYASRSGVPVEIVSKVILRHANLFTTQRYLGKVSDVEAVRWIENLYG